MAEAYDGSRQIPPDLVVKSQHMDIAGVILWLALPPYIVHPREIKGSAAPHPLKTAVHDSIRVRRESVMEECRKT